MTSEQLVQIGMRAVIRDIQDYVVLNAARAGQDAGGQVCVVADRLNAYLLALLMTAGGFDDEREGWLTPAVTAPEECRGES